MPTPRHPSDVHASRGVRARAVKSWVREAARVEDDATIMVSELTCVEPGCPPLEVVMAVLRPGRPPEQRKLHKALAEVGPEDVRAAWATTADDHHEHHSQEG